MTLNSVKSLDSRQKHSGMTIFKYFIFRANISLCLFKKVNNFMSENFKKPRQWGWFILFTSSTTLVCCVIPIVLVSLGMGAVVASLYGSLPFLSFIGLHKNAAFIITALILVLASWALFRPGRACPTDPEMAKACTSAHKWNRRLLWVSIVFWCAGFFAAYLLLPITQWLDA